MQGLAVYASSDESSRGRRHAEPAPAYRSEYQRDRDRIIHSKAFRRLEYKTQVFVNHEGDLFRTRLTHSLEAAQLSRTVAVALNLNEALCEAIALAHDLGHTPFGHAGQDALDECMRDHGGFEHNMQSLRVVDVLEERYGGFDGLNLTFETREGILKHCSQAQAKPLGEVASRFLNGGFPSLEAQVVNIADEIAYTNHDTDDALRAELVTPEQLTEYPLFARHYEAVLAQWPAIKLRRLVHEVIRRMINEQITDLVETSQGHLEAMQPSSPAQVRMADEPLITLSAPMYEQHLELKQFLHDNMYRHYRVLRMSAKARHVISRLFETFAAEPGLMPPEPRMRMISYQSKVGNETARMRAVADYIAGMTDRYAIAEYERLFNTTTLP